jgi:hypothetical protein
MTDTLKLAEQALSRLYQISTANYGRTSDRECSRTTVMSNQAKSVMAERPMTDTLKLAEQALSTVIPNQHS